MRTKKWTSGNGDATVWFGGLDLSGEFSIGRGTLGPWASDA